MRKLIFNWKKKILKLKQALNNIKIDLHTERHELKNNINNSKKDFNIKKDMTKTELSKINGVLKEVDSSQYFLAEKYENQKEKINNLIKDNMKIFTENQNLHRQI